MNSRDAAAQPGSATPPRRSVRNLLFGRRYRIHRFIALCLLFVLVAGIGYANFVSRSSTLASLPGVVRVDGQKYEVELSSTITPDQATEVFHRAREQSEDWTLILGSARLTTPTGLYVEAANDRPAVNLLHRLGTARLAEPSVITVDAYGPSIDAKPDVPSRVIPLARALVEELSAADAVVERLAVRPSPVVTVTQAALQSPTEVDAVLALLERVPRLKEVVLGERFKVYVSSGDDEADAKSACDAARRSLGGRTDIELLVRLEPESEAACREIS